MKHLSLLSKSTFACGILAAVVTLASCSSGSLSPQKAAQRLANSPTTSVFSHNDMNSPRLRDCIEVGPLPERAERALVTWLHNSTVQEFSYVYPQYYLGTTNSKGGGEVIWALCSDGRGNLVGVLAPASKHTPAWDLPTIGGYKLFVCNTSEREGLSNAIMDSLADAGYDKVRIDTRKANGVVDKDYLLSKPLNLEEQQRLEQERNARAKSLEDAKKKAAADAAASFGKSSVAEDDSKSSVTPDEEEEEDTSSSDTSDDTEDESNDGDLGSSDDDEE
ncbi:MAG: hypothetical protein J1E42_04645 [Akkermansiaceae bacterium]|nr:hypothetical protein [Akkermansiaceae bacterium]